MNERTCKWETDWSGVWFTECGNVFTFDEGGPEENKAKFCQYCGGRLIPVREKESEQ